MEPSVTIASTMLSIRPSSLTSKVSLSNSLLLVVTMSLLALNVKFTRGAQTHVVNLESKRVAPCLLMCFVLLLLELFEERKY